MRYLLLADWIAVYQMPPLQDLDATTPQTLLPQEVDREGVHTERKNVDERPQ